MLPDNAQRNIVRFVMVPSTTYYLLHALFDQTIFKLRFLIRTVFLLPVRKDKIVSISMSSYKHEHINIQIRISSNIAPDSIDNKMDALLTCVLILFN